MPVPRFQREEELVKYVVVERSEEGNVQEAETSRVTSAPTPTAFSNNPYNQAQPQPTLLQIRDDDDDDNKSKPRVVWNGSQKYSVDRS